MKRSPILCLAALMVTASPSFAQQASPTGMALQQIQAKDIEAPFSVVFPAVMTVFQDAGFRILAADKDTGLITAIGSSEARWTFNIWWGLGKKKETPIVSAFIEERGPHFTRARLNFVMSTGKDRNILTDERPVTDPAAYREAFEKIEREIFVRQAMAAPLPPTPPPAPKAPPAQAAPIEALAPPPPQLPRLWRQASYAAGISVAFIDSANLHRTEQTVRFWMYLYFTPQQGSDNYIGLREADCADQTFRDLSGTYFLGTTEVRTVKAGATATQAAPNTVNAEMIVTACSLQFGKVFHDPAAAAKLYFDKKNW